MTFKGFIVETLCITTSFEFIFVTIVLCTFFGIIGTGILSNHPVVNMPLLAFLPKNG